MTKKVTLLISDSLSICNNYDEVSPAMLQRTLSTDFYTALKVFYELVNMKVISKYWKDDLDEDGENLIGKVDKNKLKEYLIN
jgi:hypothetical protein